MFEKGKIYKSRASEDILIVDESDAGGAYHTVKGHDGVWRYARESDAGRVTGSDGMNDRRNLIPPVV